MKRKALRVRSEGSIPTYVTEAESRKQHSDSPLCNSLNKKGEPYSLSTAKPSAVSAGRTEAGTPRTV